jgi:hypothetical protein
MKTCNNARASNSFNPKKVNVDHEEAKKQVYGAGHLEESDGGAPEIFGDDITISRSDLNDIVKLLSWDPREIDKRTPKLPAKSAHLNANCTSLYFPCKYFHRHLTMQTDWIPPFHGILLLWLQLFVAAHLSLMRTAHGYAFN